MLTTRQIDIICYLCSHEGWITSEQVSRQLGIGRGTIQSEIRSILDDLGDECRIESNSNRGYRLELLTEKARKRIHEESINSGGKTRLGYWPSLFVLYFMFLHDYVTMQEIADDLYMSKSAVFLEMETVRRWIKRYKDVSLEVSRIHGIRLHAFEYTKRIYIASIGTVNAYRSMPLFADIASEYERILRAVSDIMGSVLIEKKYLLTGEALQRSTRFVAGSILRSVAGYVLKENDPDMLSVIKDNPLEQEYRERLDGIILEVGARLSSSLSYSLTEAEKNSIIIILSEGDTISPGFPEKLTGKDIADTADNTLCGIESELAALLNMGKGFIIRHRELFKEQLINLIIRTRRGHPAINNYVDEIIKTHPLEIHIACRMPDKYLGLTVNYEAYFIALNIACELEPYRRKLSVLLVCNQNSAVTEQIKHMVYGSSKMYISRWDCIPEYALLPDTQQSMDYDVYLTTEKSLLLLDSRFRLVPAVVGSSECLEVSAYIGRQYRSMAASLIESVKCRYFKEIRDENRYSDISDIIPEMDSWTSCHVFGKKAVYVCRISPDAITGIRLIKLSHAVIVKGRKVKTIIYAAFRIGDPGILEFYDTVSHILETGYI